MDADQARQRARQLVDESYPSAPVDECDVVMKGGITSGIVYPLAVCELAKKYRFRNIGGASAGAIAATMAAAAEYGRGSGGFNRLAALPEQLGHQMTALFRPQPGTKALFDVLLAGVAPAPSIRTKARRLLGALVRGRPLWFVGGLLLLYVLGVPALLAVGGKPDDGAEWGQLAIGAVILLPFALVFGLVGAIVGQAVGGFRGLSANGYGLCTGSAGANAPAGGPVHLTDWMADTIDTYAGLPAGAGPLTFRHLRDRPGAAIDLQVMTTNVTFGRPARFPFSAEASNLNLYLFCEKELARYFPPRIYRHMIDTSVVDEDWRCPDHDVPLRKLPPPEDMPVVVATRISLSFPGLVSAVPLFSVDRSAETHVAVRCWFSDGGITSNFPIHFFDTLCPVRPTFGINLRPYHRAHLGSDVYRPGPGATGRLPAIKDTGTLLGFLHGIADTMQNWSDDGQGSLPGFRDRIVDVHLHDDEGGMNLAMPPDKIALVAERGRQAAEELADFDWPQHRWTRYVTAMSELQQQALRLREIFDVPLPDGSPGYDQFVRTFGPSEPAPGRTRFYKHTPKWCDAAAAETRLLVETLAGPDSHDFLTGRPGPPRPDPDLRVTPRF